VTWQQRISPGSVEAYAFATFLVVVAGLICWGLALISNDIFIFAAFYPAVLFATYVGGSGVGVFAAVLGAVTAWWAFMPHPLTSGIEIKLLAYVFACTLIIRGAEHYRRLRRRLEDFNGRTGLSPFPEAGFDDGAVNS
jgi:hypothetical protein